MQMLGVMGIAFGIAIFWKWYSPATRSLKPIVRVVAYFADFQQVSLYPGVDVNRRLRLHENGVVSYAEERGWDIVISVDKIQCGDQNAPSSTENLQTRGQESLP
jgi:hypothetical protein